MMTLQSPNYVSLSEAALLRALEAENRHPNLFVMYNEVDVSSVARHVLGYCTPPYHVCILPGILELPAQKRGTLLISDVAAMTLSQQVALYDYLSDAPRTLQVVSLSSTAVTPLIEAGQFLEGLYYRLNVLHLDARPEQGLS
jgi:hypothetical protein